MTNKLQGFVISGVKLPSHNLHKFENAVLHVKSKPKGSLIKYVSIAKMKLHDIYRSLHIPLPVYFKRTDLDCHMQSKRYDTKFS